MVSNLVFLGATLAIVMGIGQLIPPHEGARNWLAAALLLCLGCIHLITFSQMEGYYSAFPHIAGMQIPLFTLLGPLFYLYFMRVLDSSFTITKRHTIHFVPTVLAPIVMAPYLMLSGEEKQIIQQNFAEGNTSLWQTFPNNLVVLIFISTVIYILYPLKSIAPLYKEKQLLGNRYILIALSFILCFCLTVVCVIFYQFRKNDLLVEAVAVFYTGWIVAMYLVNQKYPQFLTTVSDNIAEAKYKRSQLSNINTDGIIQKLDSLMNGEKIYLDPDLTMPALAEKLGLSSHQLSEILNNNLEVSFKDYIKKHRIDEAKRLIVEQPSQTILNISLDVGFRSLSTFNSSFKKETDLSPVEYRKSHLDKTPPSP